MEKIHHVSQDRDRASPSGNRPSKPYQRTDQSLSPKDEKVIMENPSPDATVSVASGDSSDKVKPFGGDRTVHPPHNPYSTYEQALVYGGFSNSGGPWDGYPQYFGSGDGMHLPAVIYGDNASLMYHPNYAYNPDMVYGNYSPVASLMPSIMVEGQLYSPHQIPFSPSLYPQATSQDLPSSIPVPSSELMPTESTNEGLLIGPGSGYLVHFGSYAGGNVPETTTSNPLTTSGLYSPPMGILGPYENQTGQSFEYCYSPNSSTGNSQHEGYGGGPFSYSAVNEGKQFSFENGKRTDRYQDSIYSTVGSFGFDRNRGPRSTKSKSKHSVVAQNSPNNGKDYSSSGIPSVDMYNRTDFCTDYKQAKFFVIKSFSEDNVHKSIKYNVWASTPHGNKKLDTAYRDAKEMDRNYPVFLFFSVNASGQFCGVAEMVGPVDFDRSVDHWQQDRWSGQFPVQWHIIKDVPNTRFRHLVLENNDNKPVTHSRDSQEVNLEQGIEMLKIFKDYDAQTSILDDFHFYDMSESTFKERKMKQQSLQTTDQDFLPDINQLSDKVAQSLDISRNISSTPLNDKIPAVNKSGKREIVSHATDSANN